MLHYDLRGQICGTPYPSCWKKQSGRHSAQILWPKNSSFPVIFWCTIWRTDISSEDHRQRPQDSSPVIILDRKSGSYIDHSKKSSSNQFHLNLILLSEWAQHILHTCAHTHTHTQSCFRMQTTKLYEMRGWFSICSSTPFWHYDCMAGFPSLLDSASLLLHSLSPSDSWHLYIDFTSCVQ